METANLIEQCLAGDDAAIETLVANHRRAVFRLALSILDDPAEADEATQEVFITALSSLDNFRGDACFRTWLYRIAMNLCRNRLRKHRTKERLRQTLQSILRIKGEGADQPEKIILQRESDQALRKAVNRLGEKHRLPIILYYYHDFSVAEIAQIMDIREGTVLSRLFTARERLRSDLNGRLEFSHKAGEYETD